MMNNKDTVEDIIEDTFETNPEQWAPLTDLSMFGSSESMDKTDFNALDYSVMRDEDWYKKKFPGFPDEIIEILACCDGTHVNEGKKNNFDKKNELDDELKAELKKRLTVSFD